MKSCEKLPTYFFTALTGEIIPAEILVNYYLNQWPSVHRPQNTSNTSGPRKQALYCKKFVPEINFQASPLFN